VRDSKGVLLWTWRSDTTWVGESDLRWDLVDIRDIWVLSDSMRLSLQIGSDRMKALKFKFPLLCFMLIFHDMPLLSLIFLRYEIGG
jgi:hypothetical protein